MDEISKVIPTVSANEEAVPADNANEVSIMKKVATVSLNPDGKINIAMEKADFLSSMGVKGTIDRIVECPDKLMEEAAAVVICKDKYVAYCGGNLFDLTEADIRALYAKGILNARDLTAAQVKAIQSIRV